MIIKMRAPRQVRTAIGQRKAVVHIGACRCLRAAMRENVRQFYRAMRFSNHRTEHHGKVVLLFFFFPRECPQIFRFEDNFSFFISIERVHFTSLKRDFKCMHVYKDLRGNFINFAIPIDSLYLIMS